MEIDHNNDYFLDMPHHNHFNLFNRWKYESDEIGAQFYLRAFLETRGEEQLNQHLLIMMWK